MTIFLENKRIKEYKKLKADPDTEDLIAILTGISNTIPNDAQHYNADDDTENHPELKICRSCGRNSE